jgi:hypothetical protein
LVHAAIVLFIVPNHRITIKAIKNIMGLSTLAGARIRKSDVSIAKNYLDEDELRALNNLAEQYLIFAEGQAMRRIPMTMQD